MIGTIIDSANKKMFNISLPLNNNCGSEVTRANDYEEYTIKLNVDKPDVHGQQRGFILVCRLRCHFVLKYSLTFVFDLQAQGCQWRLSDNSDVHTSWSISQAVSDDFFIRSTACHQCIHTILPAGDCTIRSEANVRLKRSFPSAYRLRRVRTYRTGTTTHSQQWTEYSAL